MYMLYTRWKKRVSKIQYRKLTFLCEFVKICLLINLYDFSYALEHFMYYNLWHEKFMQPALA